VLKSMNTAAPMVSIVVPCRNEKDHIEVCVRSILAQLPPTGGFEVIIADGISEDGTYEILQHLARQNDRVRVVQNPKGYVSSGLNLAIQAARGKIIMRMDAHTEYAPDYMCQCLEVLQKTGTDNVGGPARTKGAGYIQAAICAAYHSAFCVGGARFHNIQYEGLVDTVTYGCWPVEVFNRIGYFDEELIRNQDDEFNLRLTRAGGKIWQSPNIKSWYKPRASLSSLFEQYRQYGYWKVRVIQKHKVPASIRHVVPTSFLALLLLIAFLTPWSSLAAWSWLGLVGSYSFVSVGMALLVATPVRLSLFPILPIVFACYHFGYGLGFLCGIWDFVIKKKGPNEKFTKITRPTDCPL